jgi:hypothetical protein
VNGSVQGQGWEGEVVSGSSDCCQIAGPGNQYEDPSGSGESKSSRKGRESFIERENSKQGTVYWVRHPFVAVDTGTIL